jgi:hypothetical protein
MLFDVSEMKLADSRLDSTVGNIIVSLGALL